MRVGGAVRVLCAVLVSAFLLPRADALLFQFAMDPPADLEPSEWKPADAAWLAARDSAAPEGLNFRGWAPAPIGGRRGEHGDWLWGYGGNGSDGSAIVEPRGGGKAMAYVFAKGSLPLSGRVRAEAERCGYQVGVPLPFVLREHWIVVRTGDDPGHPLSSPRWSSNIVWWAFAADILILSAVLLLAWSCACATTRAFRVRSKSFRAAERACCRGARWLKWPALGMCALLMVVWAASHWKEARLDIPLAGRHRTLCLGLQPGVLQVSRQSSSAGLAVEFRDVSSNRDQGTGLRWDQRGQEWLLRTPIWLLVLVGGGLAWGMVALSVARVQDGECPACGHPVEGGRICPECGAQPGPRVARS